MTICEVTIKLQPKSLYTSYHDYCKGLYRSIKAAKLSLRESEDLIAIMDEIGVIYALSDEQMFDYILRFLGEDKYKEFEQVVRQELRMFPNSRG